ncbi:hypothetical protein MKZ38_000472 [Zalerion maritima]|uniref:UBA domain-containing protein n=1 Tax=Zalerion maritima TaxID=339359 RepID=A0AAD5RJ83_9PEZI|nr:hypothetical protein MKZ38_000472 [Zalerion maritima]
MDDLSGLSWSASSPSQNQSQNQKPPPMNSSSSSLYQTLRPTPSPLGSGRNTPMSLHSSGSTSAKAQPPKPSQDAFSNLVNFGSGTTKPTANLSLREQQERLEAERRRKEEAKQKQLNAQFGNGQFWDSLSQKPSAINSRTASPAVPTQGSLSTAQLPKKAADDADLFAAFKAETKVDNASFYPPPSGSSPTSGKGTPSAGLDLGNPSAWNQPALSGGGGLDGGDDDDPFGLSKLKPVKQSVASVPATNDDDDFLGDLGKPVEEVRKKQPVPQQPTRPEPGKPIEDDESDSDDDNVNVGDLNDPFEKAVSQLVELGFTLENSRRGLTESGAGLNVQAAVGWLLDDAERQARQKAKAKSGQLGGARRQERSGRGQNAGWVQEEVPRSDSSNREEPEFSKTAAAMGATFLKGANSLWKTGQKKMQAAVAEFQQEGGDPNQPKWMRDAAAAQKSELQRKQREEVTDEAMMLESGMRPGRKPSRQATEHRHEPQHAPQMPSPRNQSPFSNSSQRSSPVPKWQQGPQPPAARIDPKSRMSKLAPDDGTQAYVSPARRKKVSPQPQPAQQPKPPAEPEHNLLNTTGFPSRPKTIPERPAQASPASRSSTQPPSRTITPRPKVPPRQVPSISPAVLQTSHKQRADGTVHFKRGDYAAAHAAYSNSLSAVPQTHPIAILLLTNRALTALKTGEPRQAIDDADKALGVIGPGGGVGETIAVENGETRDMRDLYGKALSRKAEALEQLEKWANAVTVWQLCVEGGVGGANAIAGKQRCQRALAPKPKPKPQASRPAARPKPKSALSDLAPAKDSEAVERLRAANKAAEAADDEKFALADKVDAKISAWRDGKRENLRALLGSLDNVLWEGSGWKKVGMHELVMANRVKIVYMKAIAKVHPDKLPRDANTEVKLIAATVFATLNESWDKFKAENGL